MIGLQVIVQFAAADRHHQARVVGPFGQVGGLADGIDLADPASRARAAEWLHATSGISAGEVLKALEIEWLQSEFREVA